jgi:hypothetical protein
MSLTDWFRRREREDPELVARISAAFEAQIAEYERTMFEADFNEQDDDGRVVVLVPDDKAACGLGTLVSLHDSDGNGCAGLVDAAEGRLMYVECDWDSWWPGTPVSWDECPDRDDHRVPEGPNEDMSVCRWCRAFTYELRPDGETYGDHLEDCSLERRHKGRCVGGGQGHVSAPVIRGYWPNGVARG